MAVTGDLQTNLARTARNYDALPYSSHPLPQSQPSRLGAIARAFGLDAAPLDTARVLELGCASGGNIIPHAMLHPHARFVGVDLSPAQVAAGRERIDRLGLSNIEIHCLSLTDIDDTIGRFDYVICHGVYSWVPAAVRDRIFDVIARTLSPVGVACVSYNVLPGWRLVQALHDVCLAEVPEQGALTDRVAAARDLLGFLAAETPDRGAYGEMLRARAAAIAARPEEYPDHYVAHEFLEAESHPTTLRTFLAEAGRSGLAYLADCELASSIPDNHGPHVAQQVRGRVGDDRVAQEQCLDLLTGRTFRQTLLVAAQRMAGARPAITLDGIASLHFLSEPGLRIAWNGSDPFVLDRVGRAVAVASKQAVNGVERLIARYPASSDIDDCAAAMAGWGSEARQHLLDTLHRMALTGMLTLSSEPVRTGRADGERPTAVRLARIDAAAGAPSTTNLRHELVHLNDAARALLPALDGTCGHEGLVVHLQSEALAGRLTFSRNDRVLTEPEAIRGMAAERLPALLAAMADVALLEAGAENP